MTTLQQLQSLCKASIHLDINPHKAYYQKASDYLDETFQGECKDETDPEIYNKMIETDTIIELQYYPRTPVVFNIIWHYDVELAIAAALKSFE